MISDIYKIDGLYPDPHQIRTQLREMKKYPSRKEEYEKFLSELEEAGLSNHYLIEEFFS